MRKDYFNALVLSMVGIIICLCSFIMVYIPAHNGEDPLTIGIIGSANTFLFSLLYRWIALSLYSLDEAISQTEKRELELYRRYYGYSGQSEAE